MSNSGGDGISNKKSLSPKQREQLLGTLKARFEKNANRHKGLNWAELQAKLEANPGKLWSLNEMERTGGEPDVVRYDKKTGEYIFFDCSAESPKDRRRTIPGTAETWNFRRQNIELAENAFRYQATRRRRLRRLPLRHRLRVSQWRRILLCRQRVPWCAKGLNFKDR